LAGTIAFERVAGRKKAENGMKEERNVGMAGALFQM